MKNPNNKKTLLLLLVALVHFVCAGQTTYKAKVFRVKDGDTFVVKDSLSVQHTIRLAGIDCPEKKQNLGLFVKDFTESSLLFKSVIVKVICKDLYGREVAWVFYKGVNFSEVLLNLGLAWHFKQYDKTEYLQELENEARKKKIGIWSDPEVLEPWLFRKLKK